MCTVHGQIAQDFCSLTVDKCSYPSSLRCWLAWMDTILSELINNNLKILSIAYSFVSIKKNALRLWCGEGLTPANKWNIQGSDYAYASHAQRWIWTWTTAGAGERHRHTYMHRNSISERRKSQVTLNFLLVMLLVPMQQIHQEIIQGHIMTTMPRLVRRTPSHIARSASMNVFHNIYPSFWVCTEGMHTTHTLTHTHSHMVYTWHKEGT